MTGAINNLYIFSPYFLVSGVHITGNIANNNSKAYYFSFGTTFKQLPCVQLTRATGAFWAHMDVGVSDISTTGFNLQVYNRSGADRNGVDFWVNVLVIERLSNQA